MLRQNGIVSPGVVNAIARMRERSQFFFSLLPPGDGRFSFENRREFLEENGDEYLGLQACFTHLLSELQLLTNKPDDVHNLVRRAEELRVQLGFILESQDPNTVFWIERRSDRRLP